MKRIYKRDENGKYDELQPFNNELEEIMTEIWGKVEIDVEFNLEDLNKIFGKHIGEK